MIPLEDIWVEQLSSKTYLGKFFFILGYIYFWKKLITGTDPSAIVFIEYSINFLLFIYYPQTF